MTNRDWIKDMAIIDFLNILNKNNTDCVLCMLGVPAYTERCARFEDEEKDVHEVCYNCMCEWLNEKYKKF